VDHLYGGSGIDTLDGGEDGDDLHDDGLDYVGVDQLYGGEGNDHLYGGYGDDLLVGGPGEDSMTGDSSGSYDNDTFAFALGDAKFDGVKTTDWIEDFQTKFDVIDLSGYGELSLVEQFTGTSDQVMIISVKDFGGTYVAFDLDGDLKADEQIGVHGSVAWNDIIL
jgi:Ca2+-binding RTX toxin-like protein